MNLFTENNNNNNNSSLVFIIQLSAAHHHHHRLWSHDRRRDRNATIIIIIIKHHPPVIISVPLAPISTSLAQITDQKNVPRRPETTVLPHAGNSLRWTIHSLVGAGSFRSGIVSSVVFGRSLHVSFLRPFFTSRWSRVWVVNTTVVLTRICKAVFTPDTCSQIQVSRTSNL